MIACVCMRARTLKNSDDYHLGTQEPHGCPCVLPIQHKGPHTELMEAHPAVAVPAEVLDCWPTAAIAPPSAAASSGSGISRICSVVPRSRASRLNWSVDGPAAWGCRGCTSAAWL